MSAKIIISIAGTLVGGGIVAPIAFWQAGYFGGKKESTLVSTSDTRAQESSGLQHSAAMPAHSTNQPSAPSNNCTIVEFPSSIASKSLKIESSEYIAISCQKTDLKDWTGLFPKDLFDDEGSLVKNKKLQIVTEIKDEEERMGDYETIFMSNDFSETYIVGKWKNTDNKEITTVTIDGEESNKPIYLIFSEQN